MPNPPGPPEIARSICHDLHEPGPEKTPWIVLVDFAPCRQKGVLRRIVGVMRVLQDAPRHPASCCGVALDQEPERVGVAGLGADRIGPLLPTGIVWAGFGPGIEGHYRRQSGKREFGIPHTTPTLSWRGMLSPGRNGVCPRLWTGAFNVSGALAVLTTGMGRWEDPPGDVGTPLKGRNQ